MIICYFANAGSYHTIKWARHFAEAGHRVHILSLEDCPNSELLCIDNVEVHWLKNRSSRTGSELQKLGYLSTIKTARELLQRIQPDIVHAHYASSYGLICARAATQPFYLSVWGTDVFVFPRKSLLHKAMLRYSLNRCSWLFSTSFAMAQETRKYTNKEIVVTPFGVDMELFNPGDHKSYSNKDEFTIGTVKALEKKYGIDILLEACAIINTTRSDIPLKVRIAGQGSLERKLQDQAKSLGISEMVTWLGFIPQAEAACEWRRFDVGVISSISNSESFGVAAVEAQACATPLVISDIPGLMETCDQGKTAVVVPRKNPQALAQAIVDLYENPARREEMGCIARTYVEEAFNSRVCFKKVEHLYKSHLEA